MGQEIWEYHFKHHDFDRFQQHLQTEMELLRSWFANQRFSTRRAIGGMELEAWLVDRAGNPTPWNTEVIQQAGLTDLVPELARFNVEFNVEPAALQGRGLNVMFESLEQSWRQSDAAARRMGSSVVAVGILPTVTDAMLSVKNMSPLRRYKALNEQILRLRHGRPLQLQIFGEEDLRSNHSDVMLESAATSFQLHLQVPQAEAVRYLNAAMIVSAATVALAANSPFMFGRALWHETRIPVFEQAVDVGAGSLSRVTFGDSYVRESWEELFLQNQSDFPILLPLLMDEASPRLAHVRLLNGTIWRWNRPLIGFDNDGTPHLRVEHRVMAAGPSITDMLANAAFFYGLVEALANSQTPPEQQLPFATARSNFYAAARHGLAAPVQWLDNQFCPLNRLILGSLLDLAAAGLQRLGVTTDTSTAALNIIRDRVLAGQTGADWQRAFVEQHGRDFQQLTTAYRNLQRTGQPVHTWPITSAVSAEGCDIAESMLQVREDLPSEFLTCEASELSDLLAGPTLFHLPGRRDRPLFVSILLHGNEDVGLKAVQQVLRQHTAQSLPRALSLFVGNVTAAAENVRRLEDQPDYNRIWPGSDTEGTPEHAMMQHIIREMLQRDVFGSIDLHNNTGINPLYSCVTHLDNHSLQLAALFSRTAVFFERPHGVQTRAFAELCPSITCECGKIGDETGIRTAAELIDACLRLDHFPDTKPGDSDLHLFQTHTTIYVREGVVFDFHAIAGGANDHPRVGLTMRDDLERLNFQELSAGTLFALAPRELARPIIVRDHLGNDCTDVWFEFAGESIYFKQPAIPAMLTKNAEVIRQDCLGYLMNRLS